MKMLNPWINALIEIIKYKMKNVLWNVLIIQLSMKIIKLVYVIINVGIAHQKVINIILCLSYSIKYYPKLDDISNYNSFFECNIETPENYILEDNIYKPCYYSCENCSGFVNEKDNKCISCKPRFNFINFENDTNCYRYCPFIIILIQKKNMIVL